MQEGYSSKAGSLGMGLNAAKRAMDEFSVKSKAENGTTDNNQSSIPRSNVKIQQTIQNGGGPIMKEINYAISL